MSVSALPEAEPASEYGATVADAQRLMRRAKYCYVFVRVGPAAYESELVSIPKRALASELKQKNAGKAFPCELYHSGPNREFILLIGNSDAIEKAAEARR